MRCFLGLPLPPPVLDRLDAVLARLGQFGADVRWVVRADRHVTLKFLGEIGDRQRDELGAFVRDSTWPRLSLQLAGVGQFPARGAPRVVWVGLGGDQQGLLAMASRCEEAAAAAGVPREERPFHGHITLGRVRSPLGIARLQQALHQGAVAPEPVAFETTGPVLYARREGRDRGRAGSYEVLAASDRGEEGPGVP